MRAHRPILTTLAAIIVLTSLALTSTPAFGATKTRLPLPFSSFGTLEGYRGMAIDQSNGNLYINGSGSSTSEALVLVFGSEGGPPAGGAPARIGGGSTPQGTFLELHLVTVDNACYLKGLSGPMCAEADPSNGDVYVTPAPRGGVHVVDKYRFNAVSHEYEYVCQFTGYTAGGGVECLKNVPSKEAEQEIEFTEGPFTATVDGEGNVYISAPGGVYEFNSHGIPVTSISGSLVPTPDAIAVDSTGDIYVDEFPSDVLVELRRGSFTGPVESEVEVAQGVRQAALDQATGRLITMGSRLSTLSEYNLGGELELQFSLEEVPGEGRKPVAAGIAVDERSNYVYALGEGPISTHVGVFGPPVVPLVVSTEGVLGVGAESATVNGSLNPQGQEADVRFEYGTSQALSAVASPSRVSGESSVPVSAELTGLEPNRTYYYRLVGTDSESSYYGERESFATLAVKPAASARPALFVGPHEAVLVGAVNPENSDTHYRLLFGVTTEYGTSIPSGEAVDVGSSFADEPVTSSVSGLTPGTTYHYAVVASNAQGTVQSGDMSFTTPSVLPAPVVLTGAASGVSQNSATITGTVDPDGLSTGYEFDLGTDTSYGARVFAVAGSGRGPQAVSLEVGGLQPDTTYHYRVVASNVYGTVYGADMTFTTSGFPSSLIAPPVVAPLVPGPVFSPPSTAGAVTVAAPKAKARKTVKKKKPRSRKRGRKAGRTTAGNGKGRGGR